MIGPQITINPSRQFGRPCIGESRIPAEDVANLMAAFALLEGRAE